MDEILLGTYRSPWNDDSGVKTHLRIRKCRNDGSGVNNKQWFAMVSKWCRISSLPGWGQGTTGSRGFWEVFGDTTLG